MRTGQQGGPLFRVARGVVGAVAVSLFAALPLVAQPVGTTNGALPEGVAVLDLRDEDTCYDASLTGARCLPADWVLAGDGSVIAFHQLRWLLGTLGLQGAETLVLYGGAEDDTWAIAALAYLAGQNRVMVHTGGAAEDPAGGDTRSFSREVIYTAPMRTAAMTVDTAATGSVRTRLIDFAQNGGSVAFAPET